jgi:hypothetical protein
VALSWATMGVLLVACAPSGGSGQATSSGAGGQAGAGGGSGGCVAVPQPNLLLGVRAHEGPVPGDTTILVEWSGGQAGPFMLDDPGTWQSLEDSNLVCDVDKLHPPTMPLDELRCEVWTSGATRVTVQAQGFAGYEKTFSSAPACVKPTKVLVELDRGDGGT